MYVCSSDLEMNPFSCEFQNAININGLLTWLLATCIQHLHSSWIYLEKDFLWLGIDAFKSLQTLTQVPKPTFLVILPNN